MTVAATHRGGPGRIGRRLRTAVLLLGAVLPGLVGCKPSAYPAVAGFETAGPPAPGLGAVAGQEVDGPVGRTPPPPGASVSYAAAAPAGRAAGPEGALAGASAGGDITLDFADTDIRTVVAQVLGRLLGVNYTIDPAVHGTATLQTPRPLSREQLLPTLEALLAQDGAGLVRTGGLYRVVPAGRGCRRHRPGRRDRRRQHAGAAALRLGRQPGAGCCSRSPGRAAG